MANLVRELFFGRKINFCSIINIKSGQCGEDCKFCAQSVRHRTQIERYPMMKPAKIEATARQIEKDGAALRLGLVSSGNKLSEKEMAALAETFARLKKSTHLGLCASLGDLDEKQLRLLKKAGLKRYHHNLETSARFFPKVCSTHNFSERKAMVLRSKKMGLEVCSGGLFGLGENWEDRVDLALELRALDVDSVPLNFLSAIPGTPLEKQPPLPPLEILRIIAIFRLILPDKDVRCCGGRVKNLGELQSWMYFAGANSAMTGNYLTTPGRPPAEDLNLLKQLGFSPVHPK
jgi:biotin synthase